jgi:hypothetical protein
MFVNLCHTTQHHIPEYSNLHKGCETLKYHVLKSYLKFKYRRKTWLIPPYTMGETLTNVPHHTGPCDAILTVVTFCSPMSWACGNIVVTIGF